MMFSFPIIGLYQIISDILHIYVYKTEYLKHERLMHLKFAIYALILVPIFMIIAFVAELNCNFNETIHTIYSILLFIVLILIPEILIWVRFAWARKNYLYEKNKHNNEHH